jgi:hypothetical protein
MKLALPSLPSHSRSRFARVSLPARSRLGRVSLPARSRLGRVSLPSRSRVSRVSLPSRRRQSTPRRALATGRQTLTGMPAFKVVRGAARTTIALPLLTFGAFVMFLRRKLRGRSDATFDSAVNPPAPISQTPQAAATDASPANPETDLPAAPNGASKTDAQRETAKAAVADRDAPNEGAPGHEPA